MSHSPPAELFLLAAVLMRAARDYVAGSLRPGAAEQQLAEEARQWIFDEVDDDPDHIMSFRSICLAMNLDCERVRQRILRMLTDQTGFPLPGALTANPEEG